VVALWLLLAVVALGVVALARQVGLLTLRIKPLGPGSIGLGPTVGAIVDVPELMTLRSQPARVVQEDGIGVVLFASATCGLCKPVLVGAAKLGNVESDLAVTIAVDGDEEGALAYLREHGFNDGVAASNLAMLDSGNRPYAVAMSEHSVVLAAGAVNTLDQLEALADLARERRAGEADWPLEIEGADGAEILTMDQVGVAEPNGLGS
jgi:methylamine dehydrogenase accessory protein MauD